MSNGERERRFKALIGAGQAPDNQTLALVAIGATLIEIRDALRALAPVEVSTGEAFSVSQMLAGLDR